MLSSARKLPTGVAVREVRIPVGGIQLSADLALPVNAKGLVIFAHGSGSSRQSPRNRYVAEVLHEHGLGTLLADLLTIEEEAVDRATRHIRFNLPVLSSRLASIAEWAWQHSQLRALPFGYFGASTGAAAALIAAAHRHRVRAVVSRGGRPDLAGSYLVRVDVPVLLLVGECDPEVLKLNEYALRSLNKRSRLEVIPRASHLFEEPGALEVVADLAAQWFEKHLDMNAGGRP